MSDNFAKVKGFEKFLYSCSKTKTTKGIDVFWLTWANKTTLTVSRQKKRTKSRDDRQYNTAFLFHDKCMQAKTRPSVPGKKDNTAVYLCVCFFSFFFSFFFFWRIKR